MQRARDSREHREWAAGETNLNESMQEGSLTGIRLRPIVASDLDAFFEHQRDPVALRIGHLTSRKRAEFDGHWSRILADPLAIQCTVECDGAVVGYVGSFVRAGLREVAYWYGRPYWGKGIATAALREFVAGVQRPLYALVTVDHPASRRVLEKVGFSVEEKRMTVEDSGEQVEELLLRLD